MHHNKKVTYIADSLAVRLGLCHDDRIDLATCSLLHDSGITSYRFDVAKKRCSSENKQEHCVYSEHILSAFPLRKDRENVLLHHHEYVDGSGFFGISNPSLLSQIICLSNDIDIRQVNGQDPALILQELESSGKYLPDLMAAFKDVSSIPAFWTDLDTAFIKSALEKRLPGESAEKSWQDIRKLTHVLSGVIDKKSIFTARHSLGLSQRAETMADYYKFDEDKKYQFIIAADLHDLGKLAIPDSILDKPGKLNDEEFSVIKTHPSHTRRALEGINGFEEITEWASNHHEKLTGKGYPLGISDLSFESRLMAVMDIYQALTEERPYRRGLLHDEAMNIINPLAKSGDLDPEIVADINVVFND